MKQHQLNPGPLLDDRGELIEAGYATSLVKTYDRKKIKVKGMRIKEWDYYYIGNDNYGIAFTVADNSYMWLTSVTFFDFKKSMETSKTGMGWFPNGKLNLPATSFQGDIHFKRKNQVFQFMIEDGKRHLKVHINHFQKGVDLIADLILEPIIKDTMVIATPFKKKRHFYYNQKINLLKSSGYVTIGDKTYDFNNAHGVLDWGRGVWTYKNTWYWSSMSAIYQGKPIGFNLGYGFGDTSQATENMFFYDHQVYKLEDITFEIPTTGNKLDYLSPWKITSKDKKVDLIFKPIIDRHSHTNVLVIGSNQHQVFGTFSGSIAIDQKTTIEFSNLMGFAEKVMNRW
jgi:hypothetical protein